MADRYFLNIGIDWNDTANWSTSSGGGGGASVPTNADAVFFDSNSGNCTLDVNAVCDSLDSTGYTNTLTQSTFTFTVDVDMDWAAGIFAGGSAQITIGADCNITGTSTFTATSDRMRFNGTTKGINVDATATFNHNNGTLWCKGNHFQCNMNGHDVFNCDQDNGNPATTWAFLTHTVVRGDFIQTNGSFANTNNIIDLHGDFKCGNTQSSTTDFQFNVVGTGAQDIYFDKLGGNGRSGAGIICNKPSGTLTFYDELQFALTNGAIMLQYVTGTVAYNAGSSIKARGFNCEFDWDGAPRIPLFIADNANQNVGLTLLSDLPVVDFQNLGMGSLGGAGTLKISGNASQDNDMTGGSASIEFDGTGAQTIDAQGFSFGDGIVTVNKPSGTLELVSDFNNDGSGSDFVMNAGTLDLKGFNFGLHDQLIHTGGLITDSVGGGDFIIGRHVATAGTITLDTVISLTTTSGIIFSDSAGYTLNVNNYHFEGNNHWEIDQQHTVFANMVIDKCPTCNYSGTSTVTGILNIIEMNQMLSGSFIYAEGVVTGSGMNGGTGTLVLSGSNSPSIDFSGTFPGLQVDKSGGTATMMNNVSIVAGYDVVNGDIDWITNNAQMTFVGGNNIYTLTSGGIEVYQMNFQKTGTSKYTLNDSFTVRKDFTIEDTATSMELSGNSITFKGDMNIQETSLAGSTQIKMAGNEDASILKVGNDWFTTPLILEKTSGLITLLIDFEIAQDFDLNNGQFCTNEKNLTATNINIDPDATFDKTPSSTLTGTVNGTVNDVDDCKKKTNFFVLQMP